MGEMRKQTCRLFLLCHVNLGAKIIPVCLNLQGTPNTSRRSAGTGAERLSHRSTI